MSAIVVAPIETVMARNAMMTKNARAMHGDHLAACSSSDKGGIDGGIIVIVGVIVIRIVVVIDATDKHTMDVTAMSKSMPGKSG